MRLVTTCVAGRWITGMRTRRAHEQVRSYTWVRVRGACGSKARALGGSSVAATGAPLSPPPHLQGRAVRAAQQVHLIHDEQRHVLHRLALLPPPRQHVPVLRGGDNDVALQGRASGQAALSWLHRNTASKWAARKSGLQQMQYRCSTARHGGAGGPLEHVTGQLADTAQIQMQLQLRR